MPEVQHLTKVGFEMAAATHLSGLPLLDALMRVRLAADTEGNLCPHVIEDLRTMLRAAVRTARTKLHNERAAGACERLLAFLDDY